MSRKRHPLRCHGCRNPIDPPTSRERILRVVDGRPRPFCGDCRDRMAAQRRAETGRKLISEPLETREEIRDGKTFVVTVLKPKKSHSRQTTRGGKAR